MSDIAISAGMRSNLMSLSKTSSMLGDTQSRLASGRKVNSAIDNPTNFFAAANLNDRADKLTSRLDGMGQAVSTLKAADNAITGMRGLVSAMKGVVDEALASSDSNDRAALGKQFNELVVQLGSFAEDADYKGSNLLKSGAADRTAGGAETVTVQFNESFGDSTLAVNGINIQGASGAGTLGLELTDDKELATASDIQGSRYTSAAAEIAGSGSLAIQSYAVTLNADSKTISSDVSGGAKDVVGIRSAEINSADAASSATGAGSAVSFVDAANYQDNLKGMISDLEKFDTALVSTAKSLSQNVNIVSLRQDFTTNLVNTLEEGADKLTLADLNEEGANLLALQTSQQLGIQSLSLASQTNQAVLGLIG